MKVLEVNVDDHLYGGVFVIVTNIIKNLPNDITADIAALEPFDDNKHIDELRNFGSSVYYVGSKKNKILKQLDIYKNIKRIIKQNQYDVIHIHSDVSHKILISAIAARKTKKIIFHSHANDAEGKHLRIRRFFHRFCCLFLKRIPAVYLATSLEAGKWMFPWTKENEIVIIDNGIDYHRYEYDSEKREKKRKELAIHEYDFLIGFFGRFVFPKNPFFALNILKAILEKDQNIKMLCIGEGPLKQEFFQELKNQGIEEKVLFIGNTDHIEDYYQAIDVLIMPSNFEGFGLVAVESQISGTPTIVSTNVPEKTRISKLIKYLSITDEALSEWQSQILNTKSYVKYNVKDEIDYKYELHTFVDKIIAIYSE